MYSSKELLHFVFANENDTYFCNELLALNQNQYLWLTLHEQGYGCVYFLERDGDDFKVRTFGDMLAQPYPPDNSKFWSFSRQKKNTQLRKWFLKQLSAKGQSRAAVVCTLKDFCEFFEDEAWSDFLGELSGMEKRTGVLILTAPTEAEGSRHYFLHSPVFDRMHENSITSLRRANPCDMYRAMYESKPGRMVFLNNYTPGRVHSILSRQFVSDPERCADCALREHMEDYLLQWMNNPALRAAERRSCPGFPPPDSGFHDTYTWLRRDENWQKLVRQGRRVANAGGIGPYLRILGCPVEEGRAENLNISRSRDSYAWQCMQLSVPDSIDCDLQEQERISQLIEDIRREVSAPKNREENPVIVREIHRFLTDLHAPKSRGDGGTYRRILYSIRFCTQWICAGKDSEEERAIMSVVEILHGYVKSSTLLFDRERQLDSLKADLDVGLPQISGNSGSHWSGQTNLSRHMVLETESEVKIARRLLESYESVVLAKVAEMSRASSAAISELSRKLAESLNRELRSINEDIEKQAAAGTREEKADEAIPDEPPVRIKAVEKDEELVLTDDDVLFDMNYL